MEKAELLKNFRNLPEQAQTKILVNAFGQLNEAHFNGLAFTAFNWRDCKLENDILSIKAEASLPLDDDTLQQNLKDYAAVIYCLTTGNKSSEAMGWDAGKKVKPAVLREIVLTVCGRNISVKPLLKKLRQQYVDEDTFFKDYETVDEKEGRDAYERQQRILQREQEYEAATQYAEQYKARYAPPKKSWLERIGIFLLMGLAYGGFKACSAQKQINSKAYQSVSIPKVPNVRPVQLNHQQLR